MIDCKAKRSVFIRYVNKLKANYSKMNQDVLINNNNIYYFLLLFKVQYPMYIEIRVQWTI